MKISNFFCSCESVNVRGYSGGKRQRENGGVACNVPLDCSYIVPVQFRKIIIIEYF